MLFKLAVHLIKFDRLHNKRGIPDSINPHSFIPLTGKQGRGTDMSPQHEEFQRDTLTSRAHSFHVKVFVLIQRLPFLISWALVLTAKKNLSVFLNILSSFLNMVHFNTYGSESIYTVPKRNYAIMTNRALMTAFEVLIITSDFIMISSMASKFPSKFSFIIDASLWSLCEINWYCN